MVTDPPEPTPRDRASLRFLLRPKWIAFHLLVVVLVVAMVNLAFWQLRRLDHRREFNREVRANASQPIVPYTDVRTGVERHDAVEWRRVRVDGTYLAGHQFVVVNRSQGGVPGSNIVDPLQLPDGSLLLVNRGFVPTDDPVPPAPTAAVTVTGTLRSSEHRGIGQPSDDPNAKLTEIRRVDLDVLSAQFDQPVEPMYVEQIESAPPDAPALEPITAPALDEGPHLSYAIQWFLFSGCAIVGWVLAVRRSIAARTGKVSRAAPVPPFA